MDADRKGSAATRRSCPACWAVRLVLPAKRLAMKKVETNVVFGMYSGLALLMDVYHPEQPNGYGIVYISGSGWHAPLMYGAEALKDNSQTKMYATALQDGGYTVFGINHRAAPRFRYPAAIEDAQRAVRFVRHHADRYRIHPERI